MREFVYLSDNKLRQFLPEPGRRWWPTIRKVALSLPAASLELEPDPSTLSGLLGRRLRAVEAQVQVSARWYKDESVAAGEWIAFDLPLMYALHEPLVLFVNALNREDVRQTRLLLHGSARSMRSDLWEDAAQGSDVLPRGVSETSFVHVLGSSFNSLNFVADPLRYPAEQQSGPNDRLRRSVARTIASLDNALSTASAGWMTGFARVSAAFPADDLAAEVGPEVVSDTASVPGRIVVASPLYVERTSRPQT